jgi:hypothetical protein
VEQEEEKISIISTEKPRFGLGGLQQEEEKLSL